MKPNIITQNVPSSVYNLSNIWPSPKLIMIWGLQARICEFEVRKLFYWHTSECFDFLYFAYCIFRDWEAFILCFFSCSILNSSLYLAVLIIQKCMSCRQFLSLQSQYAGVFLYAFLRCLFLLYCSSHHCYWNYSNNDTCFLDAVLKFRSS